jgi:hypothetical protein
LSLVAGGRSELVVDEWLAAASSLSVDAYGFLVQPATTFFSTPHLIERRAEPFADLQHPNVLAWERFPLSIGHELTNVSPFTLRGTIF